MKRFDFLKQDYEELYKICNEADEEQNMNKARQALELIVRMFGAKKRHLFDRIAEASTKAKMPKEIIAACHQVRLVGNKASHDETLAWNKITDNDIEKCLNALFKIVAWLALSHDKKIFQATDFLDSDLEVVNKYQVSGKNLKSKRETIKKFGIDINPLDIEENILNFDNKVEDELTKDVFENDEEFAERVANLPLRQIGYGILDKREKDTYTGFVFPMFHIEKEDKIILSDIDAFIANADSMNEDFIDGKILVGLKVFDGKIYCDYEKIYLQSQNDDKIKLTAICWNKYGYESDDEFIQRIKNISILPLGIAKPIRKEYDLNDELLPFKVAFYKYVQPILNLEKIFVKAGRNLAKEFCDCEENFYLYGKTNETHHMAILRHSNYDYDIKCTKKAISKVENDTKENQPPEQKKITRKDIQNDLKYLQSKANDGDVSALLELSKIYQLGRGVKQNSRVAIRYLKKILNNESVENIYRANVMRMLADIYRAGVGIEKNGKKAIKYLQAAIDEAAKVGNIDIKSIKCTIYNEIADIYFIGDGIEKNGYQTTKWLKKAIMLNDIGAMRKLAEIYKTGEIVKQNSIKAIHLYKKIIKLNVNARANVEAMKNIAEIYRDGVGVEADDHKAKIWFNKAVKESKKLTDNINVLLKGKK